MRKSGYLATGLAAILLLSSGIPAMAQAEDPTAYGDDYQTGDFGRVRFQENGVTILRSSAEDRESAEEAGSINSPLFPGDAIRTGSDQRIELQLASGSLVRVDRNSELTLQSLPRPGADFQDNAVFSFAAGTLQITTTQLREKDEFRVDTPAASVYLLGDRGGRRRSHRRRVPLRRCRGRGRGRIGPRSRRHAHGRRTGLRPG
jgi:hypothetical protein